MNPSSRILEFRLNIPQARVLTIMANETWCLWARGTGKTQGVIAPWILHKVEAMPGSNGGLIGQSFTDLEKKILQPLFLAFGMLGYEKDVHYVYGKQPPEEWAKPLTPIIDYSTVITFQNGTTVELISLHLKGSANGKSLQWIVADEAKLLDENKLRGEVFPILRGHERIFGKSPWYGAKLFVTDKLSPSLSWILAKKKLHDEDLIGAIIYYQLEINNLRLKLTEVSDSHAYTYRRKIKKLTRIINLLRKQCVCYSEAKALDNVENLGADYFDNMRRSLTDYEYGIAIDNEDPTKAENGFYPDLSPDNKYYTDFDEDTTKPVGVVLDYQASLSPLVTFQINDMVVPGVDTLNFLDSVYVKHPLGIKHVIDDWCAANRLRPCKEVYYFYDHTAVAKKNMHKSSKDEVIEFFEANGWGVTPIYMGAAPNQTYKMSRMNFYLRNKTEEYPPIRIHNNHCASMLLSMDLTGTKETPEGTKKDKSAETDPNFPQEQATHFSDCFDMAAWAVCEKQLYPHSAAILMPLGPR